MANYVKKSKKARKAEKATDECSQVIPHLIKYP